MGEACPYEAHLADDVDELPPVDAVLEARPDEAKVVEDLRVAQALRRRGDEVEEQVDVHVHMYVCVCMCMYVCMCTCMCMATCGDEGTR